MLERGCFVRLLLDGREIVDLSGDLLLVSVVFCLECPVGLFGLFELEDQFVFLFFLNLLQSVMFCVHIGDEPGFLCRPVWIYLAGMGDIVFPAFPVEDGFSVFGYSSIQFAAEGLDLVIEAFLKLFVFFVDEEAMLVQRLLFLDEFSPFALDGYLLNIALFDEFFFFFRPMLCRVSGFHRGRVSYRNRCVPGRFLLVGFLVEARECPLLSCRIRGTNSQVPRR